MIVFGNVEWRSSAVVEQMVEMDGGENSAGTATPSLQRWVLLAVQRRTFRKYLVPVFAQLII
jgi:hypothetical protein